MRNLRNRVRKLETRLRAKRQQQRQVQASDQWFKWYHGLLDDALGTALMLEWSEARREMNAAGLKAAGERLAERCKELGLEWPPPVYQLTQSIDA